MGEHTKIAWCDHTWNPVIGCSHVHTGCENCYAERQQGRFGVTWGPKGTRRKTSETYWKQPLKWEREAKREGVRRRVFCGSLCDVFGEWPHPIKHHTGRQITVKADTPSGKRLLTMADLRLDVFRLIDQTPHLDWLLCTKRPENIRRMWVEPTGSLRRLNYERPCETLDYRSNVWLLYSASDQATLDAGLPHLLACRDLTPVLGLSLEPLVGPIDLGDPAGWAACAVRSGINWVIIGGESGPRARPCDIDDVRLIVRQCEAANVSCFVKQVGSKPIFSIHDGIGRWNPEITDPKGGDPSEWPEDVRVRQWPGGGR